MNSRSEIKRALADWIAQTCATLGVTYQRDLQIGDATFPIFLPHFGSRSGMVVLDFDEKLRPPASIYFSLVNLDSYSGCAPPSNMQEALVDWGWYGPLDLRPAWYTGHVYAAQPITAADGFAVR